MFLTRIKGVSRTYRHVRRYREITGVLLKHGFGEFVTALGLERRLVWLRRHKPGGDPDQALSRYQRARLALAELGPTFIKLGQMLSTRRDLFPPELVAELEKLQDEVPPFPLAEVQQILTEEFGDDTTRLFLDFQDTPLASASIAQVHEATTPDGTRIVLKIRRPRIKAQIETDIGIMHHLAGLTERFIEGANVFDPVRLVDEFAKNIRKELDFKLEASRMVRTRRCFQDDPRLRVPEVYWDICTERVLAMGYVAGLKVSRVEEFEVHGLDRRAVAERGARILMSQVFEHGFFHADPHPGNILVLPGNTLCLLDYGNVGTLSDRVREQLSNMILGFVERDERRVTAAVFQMAHFHNYAKTDQIEADVAAFMEDHLYRPVGDIRVGPLLSDLSRLLVRHDIHMPTSFFQLVKCLSTLEGVATMLVPDFDLLETAKPFARKLVRNQLHPRQALHDLMSAGGEYRKLMRDLPSEIRQIVTLFKLGEIGFKVEHRGLESLEHTHDQVSNRIVFGIVLAALIVGSSVMVLSRIPPKWHEIPIVGLVGFLVSGLMGFWLLYSIIKHGRM